MIPFRWLLCAGWRASAFGAAPLVIVMLYTGIEAQTLYVDDDASGACACLHPTRNDDPSCGTSARPFRCIWDALSTGRPYDTVLVQDGRYDECVAVTKSGSGDTRRVTLASVNTHGALIVCPAEARLPMGIGLSANFVTVRGFRVTGAGAGVHVLGAEAGQTNMGEGNVVEDVEVFGNQVGMMIQRNCTHTRVTRVDIHDNGPYDGLKLDTFPKETNIVDTLIEDSHIHHNKGNGILEGNAQRTVIRGCEIDNNGVGTRSHGLYMKGFEGLIQDNTIHDNTGYGIHFWAAPRGSAVRHYIAERNEVYGNGGGVVVGGSPVEASPHPGLPAGDGFPHYVEVRDNTIHHNIGHGFNYLGFGCHPAANDNSFHHNTVVENTLPQLQIVGAMGNSLLVQDNVIVGRPYRDNPILVTLLTTNLNPHALDRNIYDLPGAGPTTTPGPFMVRCDSSPPIDTYYTFEQLRTTGINQDNECRSGPDLFCGSSIGVVMDDHSRWIVPSPGNPSTSKQTVPVDAAPLDLHPQEAGQSCPSLTGTNGWTAAGLTISGTTEPAPLQTANIGSSTTTRWCIRVQDTLRTTDTTANQVWLDRLFLRPHE